jgi:hypothetical protein
MESNSQQLLSAGRLRLFVAILLRNAAAFSSLSPRITVAHFDSGHYQLVYRALLNISAESLELPLFAELEAEIQSMLDEDPEIIPESEIMALQDFLAYAYDPDTLGEDPNSSRLENFAVNVAKALLQEKNREDLLLSVRAEDLSLFPALLQKATLEAESIENSLQVQSIKPTFEEDWDTKTPLVITTTGLSFFDKFMRGGTSRGEGYGLMAPFGTCKTTLGVMLWACSARRCYAVKQSIGKIGISVLVTYEDARSPDIQHRLLMYAARISRNSLEVMGLEGMGALGADPDNPLPYEKKEFSSEIDAGMFKCERTRASDAINRLNEHTLCLDFSGSDPDYPNAGHGGPAEITSRIKSYLSSIKAATGLDYYVDNVIVDYVGLMVERDLTLGDVEDHKAVQQAVNRLIHGVSKQFGCHTWMLHQLSGQANSITKATKSMHHSDAKGSKSFAENLHFCFVVGNLNSEMMGMIHCTKHRRAPKMSPTVIQVEGDFNRVISPTNYVVDEKGNIVDSAIMASAGVSSVNLNDFENE